MSLFQQEAGKKHAQTACKLFEAQEQFGKTANRHTQCNKALRKTVAKYF